MSGIEPAVALAAAQLGLAAVGQVKQIADVSGQSKAATQAAEQQAEQLRLAAQIDQRRRQDLLDRATGSARARFGARGLGGEGGSAEAVLGGLVADGARDAADSGAILGSRLAAIDRGLGADLLQLAQARDRMALNSLRSWVSLGRGSQRQGGAGLLD